MLSLILIDIQYSQKANSSFEKGLNCQNHSSSSFLHPVKKFPTSKISDSPHHTGENLPPPHPVPLFRKSCINVTSFCQLQKAILLRVFQAFPQK